MNTNANVTIRPARRLIGFGILIAAAVGTVALLAQQPATTPPAALPGAGSAPAAGAPIPVQVPATAEPLPLLPPTALPLTAPPGGLGLGGAPAAPVPLPPLTPATPASPGGMAPGTGFSTAPAMRMPGAVTPGMPGGIRLPDVAGVSVDLDINADPQGAARQYQSFIAGFDSQREAAAHAVFGLGEAYRKLGRMDEARAQYGRILREFVDFPDLARQSQKVLTENPPGRGTASNSGSSLELPRSEEALAEERDLLLQELKLLEDELETIKTRISQGVEPTSSALPVQREILQLKQRLARMRQDESAKRVPVSR